MTDATKRFFPSHKRNTAFLRNKLAAVTQNIAGSYEAHLSVVSMEKNDFLKPTSRQDVFGKKPDVRILFLGARNAGKTGIVNIVFIRNCRINAAEEFLKIVRL